MIAEMREPLQSALSTVLGREVEISEPVLLAGGASKEAWSVDADGERLLVRRAAGGVIHRHTLSLEDEFAEVGEPHPAIELGLWWLREHRPPPREPVVVHGDYRIGNLVVGERGLVGVLDWEFAHLDEPVRDLAFALVRAWRFGVPEKRLGGVGPMEPYLERYNELTGFDV